MIVEDSGYVYVGSLIDNGWIDFVFVSFFGEDYFVFLFLFSELCVSVIICGGQEIVVMCEFKVCV